MEATPNQNFSLMERYLTWGNKSNQNAWSPSGEGPGGITCRLTMMTGMFKRTTRRRVHMMGTF